MRPPPLARQLAVPWGPPLVLALLALVLRLLHLRFTARAHVADDAVFFQEHAERFLVTWGALGTPEVWPRLREALDHASLQGVLYPLFQSLVYQVAGGVAHTPLLVAQAVLGALTVWLTFLAAERAFGRGAAWGAGLLAAVYGPFVLVSGVLLAEGLLLALQALALYLLLRGITDERGGRVFLFWGGLATGLLMLRPAFQYAGPLLALGLLGAALAQGAGLRHGLRWLAPYAGGVLLVAVPWVLLNGLVFGSFAWSRTGDAWQQVYWGIYPPNRGWWPPDFPVPPKFGVESLPGARGAGMVIETRDLDYLEAAVQQVLSTPLQALATEAHKLYRGYLHPFNNYAEAPPLVGALAVPLHRALAFLTLGGLAVGLGRARWRAPSILLGTALLATGLPFLASHIDVRYTVPPAQVGMIFAGLALAEGWRARREPGRWRWGALLVGVPLAAWAVGVPWLSLVPGLAPWRAHLLQSLLMVVAFLGAGWLGGRLVKGPGGAAAVVGPQAGAPGERGVVGGALLAGLVVAGVYGAEALYGGSWHEWSTRIGPGEAVRQAFVLPPGWSPPAGSRAEVRLYLQGGPRPVYEPVVRVQGREVARLGPAFTDAGPLRFDRVVMDSASRQGKVRADVPQWYAVPVELSLLREGRVTVEVAPEAAPEARPGEAWLRVWGDYPLRERVYEGPAVHSRILGADNAFHKLVATGHPMLWRRARLSGERAVAERGGARGAAGTWSGGDLSEAPGRQSGEYRIRLLLLAPNGDLLALY